MSIPSTCCHPIPGPGETTNVDAANSSVFPVRLDKEGQVVAKIVYFSPVTKPDPNFTIEPTLIFGGRGSGMARALNGKPVASILSEIWSLIDFTMLPAFAPLFGRNGLPPGWITANAPPA